MWDADRNAECGMRIGMRIGVSRGNNYFSTYSPMSDVHMTEYDASVVISRNLVLRDSRVLDLRVFFKYEMLRNLAVRSELRILNSNTENCHINIHNCVHYTMPFDHFKPQVKKFF